MTNVKQDWIQRNHKYTLIDAKSGFTLNVAGMRFTEAQLDGLAGLFNKAHKEMQRIEAGEIKNPDENRKVTHFTDRASYSGSELFRDVEDFAEKISSGKIKGSTGKKFGAAVINGIGGSALGPQLAQFAINGPYWNELGEEKRRGYLKLYFLDNTDSAGIADLLSVADLETLLVVNISKSGGTQETKNNMISCEAAYKKAGLDFTRHACAITMKGSELDDHARSGGWLKIFEMAESIGGRTSETSIVGHLPAALAGLNFRELLNGACHMDAWTRLPDYRKNPAYLLAAMWYLAGKGLGDRNMVIVPYSDRLILMSRYLQQLVMESIGKELDLEGNVVHQGLNVFGNKGGTDAHAFIQQLNDGRNDFFVTFIEVLSDSLDLPIGKGVSMGDYLHGFEVGLSSALRSKKRQVIEMTINKVDEFNLGMIIALYERSVAAYAELIGVNAFHQPGVQAYKLASKTIIKMLGTVQEKLASLGNFEGSGTELAVALGMPDDEIEIGGIAAKFAENPKRKFNGFSISRSWDKTQGCWRYKVAR
ncbi:MAG: hypothetical protein A2X49_00775 [Lentisphaerae bacterium GWF2_52_8]|nr:MAG: hypothetical protein A2X49_00775 [Lentisphaerae bacterium GWF2_52_8]